MPKPITVEEYRAIPVSVQHAYEVTLPLPLTDIFSRRYGLLPPIKEVRGQEGSWGQVGQTRTIVTSDGGTMREELTEIDAPNAFSYRISDVTGPLKPLVAMIDGRWSFTATGTGTTVAWRWTLHPTAAGAVLLPVVTKMWPGYARQALEQLSHRLLQP